MAIVPIETLIPTSTHSTGTNHKLDRIAVAFAPIEIVCTPPAGYPKPHRERLLPPGCCPTPRFRVIFWSAAIATKGRFTRESGSSRYQRLRTASPQVVHDRDAGPERRRFEV